MGRKLAPSVALILCLTFIVLMTIGSVSAQIVQDQTNNLSNADSSKPHRQQETDLTVTFNPLKVDKTKSQATTISGALTSKGKGVSGETITLFYCPITSPYCWTKIGTATTGAGGTYNYIWTPTIANGKYFIKAEFAGDKNYKPQTALTSCNGAYLTVIPEYLYGALAALLACFGAFVIFKRANRTN